MQWHGDGSLRQSKLTTFKQALNNQQLRDNILEKGRKQMLPSQFDLFENKNKILKLTMQPMHNDISPEHIFNRVSCPSKK